MRTAVWPILLFGLVAPALAQSDDHSVRVVAEQKGTEVRLIAKSELMREYTLTLEANLVNMGASESLPMTVDVKDQESVELVVLHVVNPQSARHYNYNYNWRYGVRGGAPDKDAVYMLPYGPNEKHVLVQGYRGNFSHQAGSANEYAYDFAMPVGTTVCAAREGVVTGIRQDSDTGGVSQEFLTSANYIVIRHSDGTYAEYLHLKRNGVLVALGQTVEAGQPIGLSGMTGFTSAPHVHFSVFVPLDGKSRRSLPFSMRTREGISRSLVQGQIY